MSRTTASANGRFKEISVVAVLACLALAIWSDAPLKELANPGVPENPAKAPWYFLGLQELVAYSAFMGGIGIPSIVLIGLGLWWRDFLTLLAGGIPLLLLLGGALLAMGLLATCVKDRPGKATP